MSEILEFFNENGSMLIVCIQFILALILFFKTGDKKILKEVYERMKYRTESNYSTQENAGQEFSQFKHVYRLNKSTNELEMTDEVIDVQEIANSCRDVCMQAILERFFPEEETTQSQTEQAVDFMLDDLDQMRETVNLANLYKEKFNLDPKLSVSQVFDAVKEKADLLKAKLNNKETVDDAQEIIEESK